MLPVRLTFAALVVLLGACRGHDPYQEGNALADHGACEQAGTALAPVGHGVAITTVGGAGGLRLVSAGGVVLGLPSAPAADDSDLTTVSRAVRHVASCYEDRGDTASLVKAFAQLQQIVESPLYLRTAEGEQQRIDAQLDRIELRLSRLDPNYRGAVEAKSRELDSLKGALSWENSK